MLLLAKLKGTYIISIKNDFFSILIKDLPNDLNINYFNLLLRGSYTQGTRPLIIRVFTSYKTAKL